MLDYTLLDLGLKQRLQKSLKWVLGAPVVALSIQSFIPLTKSAVDTYTSPMPTQIEFRKKYTYPLKGWDEDFDNNVSGNVITNLSEVLDRENIEHGLGVGSVNIIGREWYQQDALDMVMSQVHTDTGIYFNPYLRSINIRPGSFKKDDLFSVVKRMRLDEIIENNRGILSAWMPMYPAWVETPEINVIPPRALFTRHDPADSSKPAPGLTLEYRVKPKFTEDELLGQIASFAGICETMSESPEEMYIRLYSPQADGTLSPNKQEIKNVESLQEYGLIPKEFMIHVTLSGLAWTLRSETDPAMFQNMSQGYFRYTEKFFRQFPDSIYTARIRLERARIFKRSKEIFAPAKVFDMAMKAELESGLSARFKEHTTHLFMLTELEKTYLALGMKKEAGVMHDANEMYRYHYFKGRVGLSGSAIKEYLQAKGVLK